MFALREFLARPIGVIALVTWILGIVFSITGAILATIVYPTQIGLMFLRVGLVITTISLILAVTRLASLKKKKKLLAIGTSSTANITKIIQNKNVRINRKHPWLVSYSYMVNNTTYQATETILDLAENYKEGLTIDIVYNPKNASESTIKPSK
jgi:hypothetical protein